MLSVAVVVSLLTSQALDRQVNPAVLGANAITPQQTDAPWIDLRCVIWTGVSFQWSAPNGEVDRSGLLPFRLELPVATRVGLFLEGSPLEVYSYSDASLRAWDPRNGRAGITRADVRVGVRIKLFDQHGFIPAMSARTVLRTATGEHLFNRRFLDAPAYQLDGLVGWKTRLGPGEFRALVNLGFFSWQQGNAGQNDAFAWSGSLGYHLFGGHALIEGRGYHGWQSGDQPVLLLGSLGIPILRNFMSGVVQLSRQFQDPAATELKLLIRLEVDAPRFLFEG